MHAVIEGLSAGPVEMFASSGGAVTALALVATYPSDVTTLVAHEPPLLALLPDAAAAERAQRGVRDAYQAKGSGAGMAAFMAMSSWRGEYTDDYFAQPAPDPAMLDASRVEQPAARTRCSPTDPGRSPATGPTSTRCVRHRRG